MIGWRVPRRPGQVPRAELRFLAYGRPGPGVSRAAVRRTRCSRQTCRWCRAAGVAVGPPVSWYSAAYRATSENVTGSY